MVRVEHEVDGEGESGYRPADGKWQRDAKIGREIGEGMDEENKESVGYRRAQVTDGPNQHDLARGQGPETSLEECPGVSFHTHGRRDRRDVPRTRGANMG